MKRLPAIVRMKPALHPGQVEFMRLCRSHRFALATCGRRFGKTLYLHQDAFSTAVNHAGAKVWWVDPIHYMAKRAFRMMKKPVLGCHLAEPEGVLTSELRIELINGSVIEFHSAERGDRMRGEGVHRVLMNEASLIKAAVWEEILYPMLTDTHGSAAFALTPKGTGHWTYRLFLRGQSSKPEDLDYGSLQLPTTANPLIAAKYVEAARRDLPGDTFRQEYLAEFLDDGAGVFRNIRACIAGELDGPHDLPLLGPYVGGLDLAKHQDYTVLSILDRTGHLCWHERFQRLDWPTAKARIIEAARRYRARLVVDRSGVGDVVVDDLRAAGVEVVEFVFGNASKQELVQGLMVALEQGLISYPDLPTLLTELSIFEYQRLPSGAVRYQAPEGAHDDEVMALALATLGYRDSLRGTRTDGLLGQTSVDDLIARAA